MPRAKITENTREGISVIFTRGFFLVWVLGSGF